jgi:L-malate glycosyltransferase
LTKYKKIEDSILLLEKLIRNNIKATLIIVGDGECLINLQQLILRLGMQDRCILTGRVDNTMDYISACDILIHPSVSESSCVVVKEAGLQSKIVLVNKGVGDFDEYLVHNFNSFMVDKNNFSNEAYDCIIEYLENKEKYKIMGTRLKEDTFRLFDIKNNYTFYQKYLKSEH